MRYLCKKTYRNINVGNYCSCDDIIHSDYLLSGSFFKYINLKGYKFVIDGIAEPKLKDYFYTEKEIRKIKLKKLQ